jgi:hypothetical protein
MDGPPVTGHRQPVADHSPYFNINRRRETAVSATMLCGVCGVMWTQVPAWAVCSWSPTVRWACPLRKWRMAGLRPCVPIAPGRGKLEEDDVEAVRFQQGAAEDAVFGEGNGRFRGQIKNRKSVSHEYAHKRG